MVEMTAYFAVKSKLKSLLKEHKNAKFIVTGHSLGGALAILFPTVLVLHEEKEIMQRLLGIYTFGQPRVGPSCISILGRAFTITAFYIEQKVDEEPNRNFFGIRYLVPEYLNAVWELIRSLTMGYVKGPEYKEGCLSILLRTSRTGTPWHGYNASKLIVIGSNNYLVSCTITEYFK
ncbi:hypothetical protein F0562_022715 [Nyssa sinensis]|uniref:Fungal lipase-type domain-containing protein n=1 Tax=Nyssa sinensis TaxID=561372 RepID=A0A5J5BEH2_9ASTE|nr:hypothetical protein F0562_022715 [Nyssa sinensis]